MRAAILLTGDITHVWRVLFQLYSDEPSDGCWWNGAFSGALRRGVVRFWHYAKIYNSDIR
jgi:hypothetical protein